MSALADFENEIFNEECLAGMAARLPDACVDLILCDLPYGTTQCAWDAVIPFEPLWEQYRRVLAPDGVVVLTAAQPFTSALVMSNPKWYRYNWIWEKSKATGWLNAKKRPLVAHEDVLVFAPKAPRYFPQMVQGEPYNKGTALRPTASYGAQVETTVENKTGLRYPRSVQYFKTAEAEGAVIHPTQKPLSLFEYLIATYSQPGELVLDNCVGSGTTPVAAVRTGRRFVGWEQDPGHCENARARVEAELGV